MGEVSTLMPPQMTPRLFLLRHWMACHMLVFLLISGAARAEVRMIDRQPVGGGAEVVLTQSGTGGPCMLRYRSVKGGELEFYRVPVGCQPMPRIMRGEKRVSYQFMERDDCLIITLEMDEEAPRVYEDRFRNAHGIDFSAGAKLLTADELGLYNMFDPLCEEKHLLRDESGHWTFRGLPYRKKVESKVTVFTPEYRQNNVHSRKLPGSWLAASAGMSYGFPLLLAPYDQLQGMHDVLSFFQTAPSLPATVAAGPELRLSKLDEMAGTRDVYGLGGLQTGIPWRCYGPWHRSFGSETARATLGDLGLPCYDTDYDRMAADLRETYALCQMHYLRLLAYSAPGLDGMAFSALFVHELEKAGF